MTEKLMKLRLTTSAGDILVDKVQEYVCGKKYFYINVFTENHSEVKLIKRDIISGVFRNDGKSEWKINLKLFKDNF